MIRRRKAEWFAARRRGASPRWFTLGLMVLALAGGATGISSADPADAADDASAWIELAPGMRYRTFPLDDGALTRAPLHVVRIDPARVELLALFAGREGVDPMRCAEWCEVRDLELAVNLGMYDTDGQTHVGFARVGDHVASRRWVKSYHSGFAFGPREPELPGAVMLDLEDGDDRAYLERYDAAIQNLRLISSPGVSRWSENPRRWSEAALAQDRSGNLLVLFSSSPCTMGELNARLLALPLDIERAMHLEGGAQASLSIHTPALTLDLAGELVPGVTSEGASAQWPLPNVLGVRARK